MSRDDVETTCLTVLHRYSALLKFCRIESDAISEPYGLEKLIGGISSINSHLNVDGIQQSHFKILLRKKSTLAN
ncbi:hypothetical protein TNIN_350461 [Trichonephila inaurata madagascariensis]|uniref:Uncharacterized protein n=1 Tax=Trichonephila inaurata madagascariensis TaxID=2747483 RepID=A0A8X7CSG0_9ARAC|nr:hypothetical protein TNIN_350461 [Trichonephila inaurata madagascariensis]